MVGDRIVIFTVGTQGDARPCIGLGVALKRAGYPVRVATSSNFAGMVREAGLEFSPLSADFLDLMTSNPETVDRGLNPLYLLKHTRDKLEKMASTWVREGLVASEGAGLIIGNGIATQLGKALAEAQGMAFTQAQLQPFTPSREQAPLVFRIERRLPGAINTLLYDLMRLATWYVVRPAINGTVRPQLGLKPYPWYGPFFGKAFDRRHVLYGYSRHILPPPGDWPDEARVTGYWFYDQAGDWRPPPALQQFLDEGDKPVYIGFGSMLASNVETFTRTMIDAVRLSGRRALLATGWGGLQGQAGRLDDQIYVLDSAPHDWLFPRVSVAVHHGGAGTTAAAVRAGIPSVVVPFFGDQPFWAQRLHGLGVAPPALDRKTLTAADLADAIAFSLRPQTVRTAAELGERMRAEDGGRAAVNAMAEWGLLPRSRLQAVAA